MLMRAACVRHSMHLNNHDRLFCWTEFTVLHLKILKSVKLLLTAHEDSLHVHDDQKQLWESCPTPLSTYPPSIQFNLV